MSDRIVLANMRFLARHGVHDREKVEPQRFEVDVEIGLDLEAAGRSDDLAGTVDYGGLYDWVRTVVEGPPLDLLETLAEHIARAALELDRRIEAVTVRVRKPDVRLGGPLDSAGVEISRRR